MSQRTITAANLFKYCALRCLEFTCSTTLAVAQCVQKAPFVCLSEPKNGKLRVKDKGKGHDGPHYELISLYHSTKFLDENS